MHYYQFNIGDYQSHTAHLSDIEDLAYRRLLDWYYLHESPIPNDIPEIARQIRMRSHTECITTVLNEFFELTKKGWSSARANREIAKTGEKSAKASASAKARWNKPSDANALPTQSDSNATQDTEHKTQDTKHKEKVQRGTRLSRDFLFTGEWLAFCKQERPDLEPVRVFEEFKDYWCALPAGKGTKTDWFATWRNWVRRQNAPKLTSANKFDVVNTTVPIAPGYDSALRKIEEDRKLAAPPSLEVLARMAALRKEIKSA